ncbi:MAG: thiamine diphosphokinase [Deinococcales bacterium]
MPKKIKAVILAGGDMTVSEPLLELLRGGELVIAADSGLRHAKALGLRPQVIVGDFDSLEPQDLQHYPNTPQQRFKPNKDELDLELAINYAKAQAATDIIFMGATGGRLDQSLAALFIAAKLQGEGVNVSLDSGKQRIYPLTAPATLELPWPNTILSLLSLSESSDVSLTGTHYPLNHAILPFGVGLGVSNVIDKEALLNLHQGQLLVILEYDKSQGMPWLYKDQKLV